MSKKKRNHRPVKLNCIPWVVCDECGLIYLKNEFTEWCIQRGCDYEESPGYKSARERFTALIKKT